MMELLCCSYSTLVISTNLMKSSPKEQKNNARISTNYNYKKKKEVAVCYNWFLVRTWIMSYGMSLLIINNVIAVLLVVRQSHLTSPLGICEVMKITTKKVIWWNNYKVNFICKSDDFKQGGKLGRWFKFFASFQQRWFKITVGEEGDILYFIFKFVFLNYTLVVGMIYNQQL